MHIDMHSYAAAAHLAAAWVYNEQQVHCIFRFSLRSQTGKAAASATVEMGRTPPFPPSGNEGYLCNKDVPIQSVTFNIRWNDRRIGIATKVSQELPPSSAVSQVSCTPLLKDGGTGQTQRVSITAVPQNPFSETIG